MRHLTKEKEDQHAIAKTNISRDRVHLIRDDDRRQTTSQLNTDISHTLMKQEKGVKYYFLCKDVPSLIIDISITNAIQQLSRQLIVTKKTIAKTRT